MVILQITPNRPGSAPRTWWREQRKRPLFHVMAPGLTPRDPPPVPIRPSKNKTSREKALALSGGGRKKEATSSTPYSRVVPHPSTDDAHGCLTSEFGMGSGAFSQI